MVSGEMCSAAPFSVGFNHQQVTVPTVEGQRREEMVRGGGKIALNTNVGIESSITYAVALGTGRTLGPWQTSVSFLSLLTRGSDQANQTWVTLQGENKKVTLCAHTLKLFHACVTRATWQRRMSFIKIQIFGNCKWNVSPAEYHKATLHNTMMDLKWESSNQPLIWPFERHTQHGASIVCFETALSSHHVSVWEAN